MAGEWDAAQANIAVKYDPQQAALQRQLELSQKNTASGEQAIQGYGTAGRNVISDTYNTLYGLLGANKTDTQNALNQQLGLTNQGYDTAIRNIQGYQQNSRDYIAKMAADLGQSGQGLVSSGKLEDVTNQQLGYANAARTNYGSTLSDWISKMGSLSDLGIANAHQAEALRKSGFESELLAQLGQNKLAGTTQETDVINKIADLMNVRQSDLVDMYNQLVAAQWDRDFKQAQLNEQASEASADLAYKYASLDASNANAAASRAQTGQMSIKDWYDMVNGQSKTDAAQRQQDLDNAFRERELGLKYPGGGTPGDASDLQNLINAGVIKGGDTGAANAYLESGYPGLQAYNVEMGGRQQIQDILKGLNTGGGRGGMGNIMSGISNALFQRNPQWAQDFRSDLRQDVSNLNPLNWNLRWR